MTAAALDEAPRVVIVDDTADLRELLRYALVRGGMSVVGEAGDGLSGIEMVRTAQPDIVLLDLSMPVMDGLAALPEIRALVPDARIIVLSGFGAHQMAERALAIGADGYLQKGASLGRILDQIRDIVQSDPVAPATSPVPGPRVVAPAAPTPVASPVRDAMSLAPFGVVEVEAEPPYRVVRVNPAASTLLDVRPVAGDPLAEIAPGIAATVVHNRLAGDVEFDATTAGRPVRVTLRHTDRSLLIYLHEIGDDAGHLRTAIATTAHELRGPVSVLCAVAETILEEELTAEQLDKLMGTVNRQARLLDNTTGDLLVAAQLERGTLRIDARPVVPAEVVDEFLSDQGSSACLVEVSDHRQVMADPLRLQQMLGNLVGNAHKYGEPPVTVRVRASTEHPSMVCIDVEDAGPGVPEEFRPHLFREFSRASGTERLGTGLGLHVVHTLAKGQGGSVRYAPGSETGSVFTISLPTASRRFIGT